jgi:GT2 family glycosyltransferase
VGVVVIGRNEGERLARCLATVCGRGSTVVYVDSGSTDGSVDRARGLGADVVELDLSTPFTAARARNQGFDRLVAADPGVKFVQFVDGDCEIAPGWIEAGLAAMDARPEVAVACGRLREMRPEASPYNRLADMEWDGPVGEVKACGGIFLARVEAFRWAGGFDPTVLAAEDDEFCLRIRRDGGRILRLPDLMGRHDMAMTRFSAWWRRCVRTGQAYAQGYSLHGRGPDRHFAREIRGVVAWGMVLPAVALALAWPTRGLSLLLPPLGYAALFWKVKRYGLSRGWSAADSRLYAASVVVAKVPLAWGVLRYAASRLLRRDAKLIEHKGPAS